MMLIRSSGGGETADFQFIKQDTEKLFKKLGFLETAAKKITDTAATAMDHVDDFQETVLGQGETLNGGTRPQRPRLTVAVEPRPLAEQNERHLAPEAERTGDMVEMAGTLYGDRRQRNPPTGTIIPGNLHFLGGSMTAKRMEKIKTIKDPSFPIRLKIKGGGYVDTVAVNPFMQKNICYINGLRRLAKNHIRFIRTIHRR